MAPKNVFRRHRYRFSDIIEHYFCWRLDFTLNVKCHAKSFTKIRCIYRETVRQAYHYVVRFIEILDDKPINTIKLSYNALVQQIKIEAGANRLWPILWPYFLFDNGEQCTSIVTEKATVPSNFDYIAAVSSYLYRDSRGKFRQQNVNIQAIHVR